jgi:hypothetical protein
MCLPPFLSPSRRVSDSFEFGHPERRRAGDVVLARGFVEPESKELQLFSGSRGFDGIVRGPSTALGRGFSGNRELSASLRSG